MAALIRIGPALAAVAFAGCSFGTDDPAATVNDFRDAVSSGDIPGACEEVVPDAQVLFYPQPVIEDGIVVGYTSGCANPSRVELDKDARTAASGTTVLSSETNGDSAEVATETSAGERLVFSLIRIDERWRIKAPAELLTDLDSRAKSAARQAQTAMESYAAQQSSRYTGADVASLRDEEPNLNNALLTTATGSGNTYEVGVTSASGTEFTITREGDGSIVSRCNEPELGGCASGGIWAELAG